MSRTTKNHGTDRFLGIEDGMIPENMIFVGN